MKPQDLTDKATHFLRCRHCIGRSCHDYVMACSIQKTMKDGRLKISVYGDRYWQRGDSIRVTTRYVEAYRVYKAEL